MGVACLEFRGENFHEWLKNRKICESFLPRKFHAIWYKGCMSEGEEDTPVWSVGSLKTAGGCVILVSLEPGGWKYRCALGV